MPAMVTCPACKGTRAVANAITGNPVTCPVCNGTGRAEPALDRRPYAYVFNQTLTASQAITSALQIDARADFELIFLMSTQTGTFTAEISDASGRTWQNLPVNNANQFGTAQNPAPLPVPFVLPARTSLTIRLTDTSVAGNTVQLVFAGYELYPIAE